MTTAIPTLRLIKSTEASIGLKQQIMSKLTKTDFIAAGSTAPIIVVWLINTTSFTTSIQTPAMTTDVGGRTVSGIANF